MRIREAAGYINRAKQCYAFVKYGQDAEAGVYLPITRVQAKALLDHAKDKDVEEVDVEVTRGGDVRIGDEIELVGEGDEDDGDDTRGEQVEVGDEVIVFAVPGEPGAIVSRIDPDGRFVAKALKGAYPFHLAFADEGTYWRRA